MRYRDTEYSIIQEAADGDAWKWSVRLDEWVQSGTRKTREAALTAIVLTIDRWKARKPKIEAAPARDHAAAI
jgi:hypothetical protein